MKPQILLPDVGRHNQDLAAANTRLLRGRGYRDCATIVVIPLHPQRAGIHPRVVQAMMNLLPPMNQKFNRIFMTDMEVGAAYSTAIETILAHPELSTWQYVLTMEDDNLPPADGLIRLIESLEDGGYGAVGGLYWTKGEGGQPMVYGDPKEMPRNFRPQVPIPEAVQPCNGLGMGFTLFRLSMFKDPRIARPWFRTVQDVTPAGTRSFTQDLWFFNNACGAGFTFASDNRVKVGHLDLTTGIVW
jgi:hypothetical protein